MKIAVLTPIYATTTTNDGATPVVHYFTREWVKMGHEVTVFHLEPKYPRIMYWVGNKFQHHLNTKLGMLVPVEAPKDEDYKADGVTIYKRCLRKIIPHSRYSKKQLSKAFKIIEDEYSHSSLPDWFLGHWDNPQLELLNMLKHKYGKPTCLVLHGNVFDFERKYGKDGLLMFSNLDAIGFRSKIGQLHFEQKYGKHNNTFIASSGVSDIFISTGFASKHIRKQPIHNFIYVGSLIARKYPSLIIKALTSIYPDGNFMMTYIGDGAEKSTIEDEYRKAGSIGKIRFTGRIPREEIIEHLLQADVFIMISRSEIFGLVYLEAMALGLIPIGSKNEGIDGVIQHGQNGFLCEAGNLEELCTILQKIKTMPSEQIQQLSLNAQNTAIDYSDEGVAKKYLESLMN